MFRAEPREEIRTVQGNLSEFNLGELLQLFAISEKSGTIEVYHDAGESRLFLEAGRVVGWGLEDFDVHGSIVACRFLTPSSRSAIQSIVPEPGAPGLAFVIRNLIEPRRWSGFVQRLIEQDIYTILDEDSGEFRAVVDRIPPVPLSLDMTVQQLILDGSRWEADSSVLAREGYSVTSRWVRSKTGEIMDSVHLSPQDWLVLSILAEPHSIGDAAAGVCLPDLETAETVKSLHLRELVKSEASG